MKRTLLFLFSFGLLHFSFSQQNTPPADAPPANSYQTVFKQAYINYPEIPQGILEAVAFSNTRFAHITHTVNDPASCVGLPKAYGVMGLTLNGQNYFRNNLVLVSTLSGYQTQDIINDPSINILAYAKAYASLISSLHVVNSSPENHIPVLIALSELPDGDLQNNFALNTQLYSILNFLNNKDFQLAYQFPEYNINLLNVFGQQNYKVLSSPFITVTDSSVIDKNGNAYEKSLHPPPSMQSSDYGSAIWNPTTCNYSSRGGTAISAVAIHDMEGSYAGSISWFKNCNAQVSAHYCLRSSDGQITEMVRETDKAWHIGSENPYTIGLEHEGYANQTGWYTTAMYTTSAALVSDICNSGYGISPTTCWNGASCSGSCVKPASVHIKGHQMFPNQTHTDPGINWDWPLYYCLINNCNSASPPPTPTVSSNSCGNKTLTRASPPSGVTYYWQGTSCGTSTANSALTYSVTSSGTYYLRAKNSSGTWSSCSSQTVTINLPPANPPTPTTTTNACGSQTLTRGTPPSGETYYWQGTSCGTSTTSSSLTYTAAASGTYYLRSVTSAGCWSSACTSVAAVVASNPATPTISNSTNSCGSITLTMGTAPAGQVYYWQGTSCGTTATNSASTFTANTSGNYYLRSQSSQGCWSSCASEAVTITPCPVNLSASIGPCPAATASFSWINSSSTWTLQVSLDSAFNSFYSKPASNVNLLTGPTGFTPALTFQANATYYWRIATGSTFIYGSHFSLPFCDVIVPATAIAPISGWKSTNFSANFLDADDSLGSGIGKSFYRVVDYNGTEWRANGLRGFANDNFDNNPLSADWTSHTGTWANAAGFLVQSNEAENNSNLSAHLTQNLSNRYLYHWNAKIEGSGANRSGGFHFFSDSASLPNRGNGYLISFSIDDSKLNFYKISNDVPALVKSKNFNFIAGQFYDYKLVYDRISGKMDLYINNTLAESWMDATPIATGNYVSFRTNNASMTINYFKAFRSRLPSVTINVGAGNSNDIRFENAGPTLAAGKIESLVSDVAGNLSPLVSIPIDVDWTPPSAIAFVNDGGGPDIITTYDSIALTGNWSPSADPNSGIVKYHYSIGTTPGATDVVGSTDNFLQLIATKSPLPLIINQIYYFNVWSENGAGLLSSIVSSNGQKVVHNVTNIEEEITIVGLNLYPNPFSNNATLNYTLPKAQKVQISLYDILGKELVELKNESEAAGNYKITIDGSNLNLSKGLYLVVLKTEKTSAFIKVEFK